MSEQGEGRYQYLEKIGEGGMATVYRGIQKSLNRQVAIKVLDATLSENPTVIKRFKRESLIIARLNHPNIIHVIDKGTTSKGRPVFIMEFVEGITLADAIREQTLHFNQKVDIAIQICKGVAYAHKLDVIHRDLKPANVLIDREGHARLLDFGIASFFEVESADDEEGRLIMGTEAYMAPEQHQGIAATTALSDIYSLGVVMHELFSGVLPMQGRSLLGAQHGVPEDIVTLVCRCLAREPAKRPQSVEEVKNALLLAMQGQHIDAASASRAGEGMTAVAEKFGLLDVMQEDKFGAVYLYEDKVSRKLLVIKKRLGSEAGYREARMLQNLKHANLVNVLGVSKNDNLFIVVMEYMAGGSLKDRLLEPMPLQRFLDIAIQMGRGLSFAHQNRIYHGNLRPSNVLLSAEMEVKLCDFGMDEHYRLKAEERDWYSERRGAEADEFSDIYALGAVFYHMLTSMPPDVREQRLVKSQRFVEQPVEIQLLVERMLSPDRDRRPQSVEAVISELLPLVDESKTMIKKEAGKTKIREIEKHIIQIKHFNVLTLFFMLLAIASVSLNVLLLGEQAEFTRLQVLEHWAWFRSFLPW